MTDDAPDETQPKSHQLRRHLSVIQAQTEFLLDETVPLSSEVQEGIRRIQRSSTELTTLIDQRPGHGTVDRLLPPAATPDHVDSILVYTHNEYLSDFLSSEAAASASPIEFRCLTSDEDVTQLAVEPFDLFLTDAVWPDRTGLDIVAELDVEAPAYGLLSLYSDGGTPLALALSGLLSPVATTEHIDTGLGPYTTLPANDVAGFLTDTPGDALTDRLEQSPETAIGSAGELAQLLTETTVEADVVCLDAEVYRRLPPGVIGRLRHPSSGRGRPLILVTPTEADPYDRSWIPTVGGRKFLSMPPHFMGLVTSLLQQRQASGAQHT